MRTRGMFFALVGLGLLAQSSWAAAMPVHWTVAVYAGTDEEELGPWGDKLVSTLLHAPMPDDVEVLIEQDRAGSDGEYRFARRAQAPLERTRLAEADSASPETLARFLEWAGREAHGEHKLLIIATHSWGWKGIVQDYSVPGHPKEDTMMPLREFARVVRESGFAPDILFLDSCILGTVEAVDQLRGTSRYLVVSQRETPYPSFPYEKLLAGLGDSSLDTREVARRLPETYVRAFVRDGSLAAAAGDYEVVTYATIDMANWDAFTGEWAELTRRLRAGGLRERLEREPEWPKILWDEDWNVDVLELLHRLPLLVDTPEVREAAARVLERIGYPIEAARKTGEGLELSAADGKRFRLQLEGDELIKTSAAALKAFKQLWHDANEDLDLPADLRLSVRNASGARVFEVQGVIPEAGLRLRPWLPGVRHLRLIIDDKEGTPRLHTASRDEDFVSVREFPESSIYVSEAHTQGAPFIHGLGIDFLPLMNKNEVRSEDPITGLAGPAFYETLPWNQHTGWGDLIFLNP